MDVKYELSTEKSFVKDSVKAILSTVLFQRLFGPTVPQTREVLGVTYPCVTNASIDTLIEEKTSALLQIIEETGAPGEIGVQFYERRSKKPSWFGKAHEDVCWEQWVISVTAVPCSTELAKESIRSKTASRLREILAGIVFSVNSNRDYIPPITTTDLIPFPYEIKVIPASAGGNESWGSVLKKMLVE